MASGWIALAASFVVLALDRAVTSTFAILILPLQAELGVARATVTLIFTAHMLVYSITSLFSGLAINRIGPRLTIGVGGALLGLGLICMSTGHTLLGLVLSFGLVCGCGIALIGIPANFVILSERFPTRVATAMGIAGAGMGIGVLVIIPLIQWCSEQFGWRHAVLWMGVAVAFIVAICVWLQMATSPAVAAPTSARNPGRDGEGEETLRSAIVRMKEIARSWRWQGFALANFLMGSALFGIVTHQVAFVRELGWTALAAATALGGVNVLRSVAGPLWGIVLDRFGRRLGYGSSTALALFGITAVLLIESGLMPANASIVLFIVAFGIGSAGTLPTNASLGSELFSRRDRGIAWGLTETAYAAGAAFGSWAVGELYDLSGSYVAALVLVGVQFVASYALVMVLSPRELRARA